MKKLRDVGILLPPQAGQPLTGIPDDTVFLECAEASKADYLVTVSAAHFPEGRWKYTKW